MKLFVDFTGKTVLVTGASSGIGRQTSISLSEVGAKVVLVARNEERLQETISSMEGDSHKYYCFDFSKTDEIESLVKQVVSENGPLDGMVYCAGTDGGTRTVKMAKPEYVEDIFKVNFFSFYELVRCITKRKNFQEGMSIVGISSCAAVDGDKGQSVYSATKAAMDSAVKVMAQEYADKKIRLNTLRPGMIDTPLYRASLSDLGEELNNTIFQKQFLGLGKTEDVANYAVFLLSPLSQFVTGANIAVDGGYTCH